MAGSSITVPGQGQEHPRPSNKPITRDNNDDMLAEAEDAKQDDDSGTNDNDMSTEAEDAKQDDDNGTNDDEMLAEADKAKQDGDHGNDDDKAKQDTHRTVPFDPLELTMQHENILNSRRSTVTNKKPKPFSSWC